MDRVIIKEDLSRGQLIRAFTVTVDGQIAFNGTAVGRTLIARFDKNMTGVDVELKVSESVAAPSIRLLAVPDPESCEVEGPSKKCHFTTNTRYQGPIFKSFDGLSSLDQCCAMCTSESTCACFVATKEGSSFKCDLLNAQTGSAAAPGVTSGTP